MKNMMLANIAVCGTIVFSICTVLSSLAFIPLLYQQISDTTAHVQLEISEFNVGGKL